MSFRRTCQPSLALRSLFVAKQRSLKRVYISTNFGLKTTEKVVAKVWKVSQMKDNLIFYLDQSIPVPDVGWCGNLGGGHGLRWRLNTLCLTRLLPGSENLVKLSKICVLFHAFTAYEPLRGFYYGTWKSLVVSGPWLQADIMGYSKLSI